MDDRKALMAAIIANPDEDTPRLALADWLQEHGDAHDQARAEFIRLQIQLATMPTGKAHDKAFAAAKKLETKHREAWLAPMAALGDDFAPEDYIGFKRGLLSYHWAHDNDRFLLPELAAQRADALAAVGVEELCFFLPPKPIDALVASPALRWVARIQYPDAGDATLAKFGRAPNLAHLSGLNLPQVRVTDKGLHAFAAKANMPRLRKLELDSADATTKPQYSAAGVLALLKSGRFPRFDTLIIEGVTAKQFDAPAFFSDPALKQLTLLSVEMRVPMKVVVACPHLTNLRELRVHRTRITDADVDALLASDTFANLKTLVLSLPTRIPAANEKKLRKRFGDELTLDYADEDD